MFCDRCGNELQSGQKFCSSCGKPLGAAIVPQAGNPVEEHIHLLAIFWLVYSIITLIGGAAILIIANTLFARFSHITMDPEAPVVPSFLQPLLSFLGMLVLVKAVAGIAAGAGLMQRQPWARILALILGFISLLNIPFGTAVGIYTIWVLLSPKADQEYKALATVNTA